MTVKIINLDGKVLRSVQEPTKIREFKTKQYCPWCNKRIAKLKVGLKQGKAWYFNQCPKCGRKFREKA